VICIDCPDLPNGTRKRQRCCKLEGAQLQIGDVVGLPKPMSTVRPNAALDNRPTFHPSRGPKRLGQ
jgi:hypothetical protein